MVSLAEHRLETAGLVPPSEKLSDKNVVSHLFHLNSNRNVKIAACCLQGVTYQNSFRLSVSDLFFIFISRASEILQTESLMQRIFNLRIKVVRRGGTGAAG